jgi:Ras GTPase-activating-like protein IQGAP2/3
VRAEIATGKNPPVGTIKNFVHLLNDSNFDFEEEIGMSLACEK